MPFESKAQQGYLFANKPEVAKEFAAKTPKSAYKKLPKHKKSADKGDQGLKALRKKARG